ncbi:hypothetical protein F442_18403 [Phytophthora nicotianae P10297]|uniref:Uncharacterized protein n=2 Tax=Phytophthora nicotianae TaxID=4792 RepID=W2YEB8_PHYNI|nr:hypothetical protein F442_18403 [Phytophthora nicotianae P10297]
MDGAAGGGHFEVLLFLQNERSEGCTSKAFVNATTADELTILQWLFEHYSKQFGRDPLQLYAFDKFYTLRWLKQKAKAEGNAQGRR